MTLAPVIDKTRIANRGMALAIFGVLFSAYLFTYTGYIQSSDGLSMFATVESMVRRGEIDSNQLLWMGIQQGSFGPDGELYSRKGVGAGLLAYPLVWLAQQWPGVGLVQAALLLNPLLTAWTGALLYRAGRRLSWSVGTSTATALLFGLATMVWPYTQTFFSDPVCGWGLFAAFYGLFGYSQVGRKRYLLGSGVAWGLTYLARSVNLITLPIFLAALVVALHRRHGKAGPLSWNITTLRRLLSQHWRPLFSFLLPVVLAGLLSLWWNALRYGNVWDSGYVESESFSAPWLFGLFGLLLGPARGFFWYSPILLLGAFGIRWFWRQARWLLLVIALLSAVYFLLYGKWYMWHGGYSWGPRFLVPILPFLALLVGPAWEQLVVTRRWGNAGRLAMLFIALIAVGVQWLGLLIPFGLVQDWLAATVQPLFAPETFTSLTYSPLVRQWQFITAEQIHLAWWRTAQAGGGIDWQGLLLPLIGMVVSVAVLLGYRRQPKRESTQRLYGLLHSFILIALTVALLINYQYALAPVDQRAAAGRIERVERAGDAILLLRPAQTQQFANLYHGHLPTYGLMAQEQLDGDNQAWLERLQRNYQRLWVISDDSAPEQSGWERPLRTADYLLGENRLPATENSRLALYALAGAQQLTEGGLGLLFGDPNAEQAITEANGWMRLNGYGLTTQAAPGGDIVLALRWESLHRVDYNYHIFVHLIDPRGEKIDQRDGQPVQWLRPTSSWQPGERIIDHYGFMLPNDALPGNYQIVVGLYDPVTGQRLPVSAGPGDFAVELGPVLVADKAD